MVGGFVLEVAACVLVDIDPRAHLERPVQQRKY
jgi:hypothetical protein